MDHEVQDFIRTQRSIGVIVTRSTVIAIGKDVVMRHNKFLLSEFGGHISLTSHWAESILHRMKFGKRKGSTKVCVLGDTLDLVKQIFLNDIQTKVVMCNGGYSE